MFLHLTIAIIGICLILHTEEPEYRNNLLLQILMSVLTTMVAVMSVLTLRGAMNAVVERASGLLRMADTVMVSAHICFSFY